MWLARSTGAEPAASGHIHIRVSICLTAQPGGPIAATKAVAPTNRFLMLLIKLCAYQDYSMMQLNERQMSQMSQWQIQGCTQVGAASVLFTISWTTEGTVNMVDGVYFKLMCAQEGFSAGITHVDALSSIIWNSLMCLSIKCQPPSFLALCLWLVLRLCLTETPLSLLKISVIDDRYFRVCLCCDATPSLRLPPRKVSLSWLNSLDFFVSVLNLADESQLWLRNYWPPRCTNLFLTVVIMIFMCVMWLLWMHYACEWNSLWP